MGVRWVVAAGLALAGCSAVPGGAVLVSAQSPPGTGSVNGASEPQPVGSLPAGAANVGTAPGAVQPSYGSVTFGGRR